RSTSIRSRYQTKIAVNKVMQPWWCEVSIIHCDFRLVSTPYTCRPCCAGYVQGLDLALLVAGLGFFVPLSALSCFSCWVESIWVPMWSLKSPTWIITLGSWVLGMLSSSSVRSQLLLLG